MTKIFLTFSIILMQVPFSFGQVAAITIDGKKVLLETNHTWKYIDSLPNNNSCNLPPDFVEPKSTKAMYNSLKWGGATIEDLRQYSAVDNDCPIKEIIIVSFSEQAGNGIYNLCVKGRKMKYRRTGTVFSRFNENLLKGEY